MLRREYAYDSRPFLAATRRPSASSSSLYFSASASMRSISSLDSRPLSLVMTILLDLPVPFSTAETFMMPLASTSNVTSICGTPRRAGGMPVSSNLPRRLLSLVRWRSPSYTWMSTPGWLSEKVEKTSDFLVGMVVLRGISLVIMPPAVSIPRESGATSSSRISLVDLEVVSPDRMAAWTAAP